MERCATCLHWSSRQECIGNTFIPQARQGVCTLTINESGESDYRRKVKAIAVDVEMYYESDDVPEGPDHYIWWGNNRDSYVWLETDADFGCVQWEKRTS